MSFSMDVVRDASLERMSDDARVRLFATMCRIRRFEERLGELHLERDEADRVSRETCGDSPPYPEEKRIRAPCHLYIGQEAVATGACAALRRDDWIWSTHRAHGHYLAKGGDLVAAMDEIFCRRTGCSGGRGGSMHLCAPEVGFLGSSAIVSGTVPLGVGAAMAEYVLERGRVSMIFHGDAVPEEGVFHESLNWAVLRDLPVVFVCENNLYSTHLHIRHRRKNQNLGELIKGYGLPVVDVDGNDVRAVLEVVAPAVERARAGDGPTFVQAFTYRWRGHVGPYDNVDVGLRSKDEIDEWLARCPIDKESERLLDEGLVTQEGLDALKQQVDREIEAAVEHAVAAPRPLPGEARDLVFRD